MQRSQLVIVDGEHLNHPELAEVLGREGWDVAWLDSADADGFIVAGPEPDLVLVDPIRLGALAEETLTALKGRRPGLPVVALGAQGEDQAQLAAAGLDPSRLHRMGRDLAPESWPATLRSCLGGFGPGAQKFTAEDLFGDILADMEDGPGSVPARAPITFSPLPPRPAAPAPPAPPRPVAPPPAPLRPAPPAADPARLEGLPDLFLDFLDAPPAQAAAPVPEPPAPAEPVAALERLDQLGTNGRDGTAPDVAPAPSPYEPEADSGLEEFGNYYLLEKVAVGGMAELFKARQRGVHDFEKIVAIKRILPHLSDNDEFVRMFIDEAKLAAQLTHPNIVQIFDLGKAGGFYYIAMEFVDGRDLRSLLRKVREFKLPLPESIAAAVTMRIANALDYAHRKRGINDRELKLVHRDISPQNILISYDGAVKLVDFGIAKAATKSTQTMAGALKGKLLYMSPEQALGQQVDGRSDLYSLGLVLFELLTGERCFQADSELGVLEKVRLGKVQDARALNPAISPEMVAVLDKVLQKNVDLRYASARLLERDLKSLLVRHGNEPNEHDVAEYVNTVLKGTRDEVVGLLASRYGPPASSLPPAADASRVSMVQPEAAPLPVPNPSEPAFPRVAPEPADSWPPEPAGNPRWLMPALVALVLVMVLVAWRVLR
jgi:serine/threonine protein kinase/CheY-like chemotaxis protein